MKIKRNFLSILLALVMFVSMFPLTYIEANADAGSGSNSSQAETFKSGDYSCEIISKTDKTIKITYYDGNATDLNIPAEIDGYTVTSIGESAFLYNDITTLAIPDTVIEIESYAFQDCENLINITIGASVKTISSSAFRFCKRLANFEVSLNNNTYKSIDGILFSKDEKTIVLYPQGKTAETYAIPNSVTIIGESAFDNCNYLTDIVIPNGVTTIEDSAFYWCDGITNIIFPNTLTKIGSNVFYDCDNITSITIPESVESIGQVAFANCSNLLEIVLPDTAIAIDSSAFDDTAYYNDEKNWENDVLYIGKHLIEYSSKVIDYSVKEGTLTIALGAFGWSDVETLSIPDSVIKINENAFLDSQLKNITIGENVQGLDTKVFFACDYLININISPKNEFYSSVDGVLFSKDKTELIVYPSAKEKVSYNIPNGVTKVGTGAFAYCKLTSITIPESVEIIGYDNFELCDLIDIKVSLNNKYFADVDGVLFNKDKNILISYPTGRTASEYVIPSGVKIIGDFAFYSCIYLTNVIIPDGVQRIEDYAFAYCTNFKTVTIPASVLFIGENSFIALDWFDIVYKTIKGYNGTYAETYAKENGHTFVSLGNVQEYSNKWVEDEYGWRFYNADGSLATNKWLQDSQGWCFVGDDGYCVTNDWKADSKGWCYLDANGRMVINNWVLDIGKWYFMDENGYMVSNQWRKDSKGWCYLSSSGAMSTNAWIKDSAGWCYVGADGYCIVNKWVKDSVSWCYLDASGRMVTDRWIADSKGWCYVGSNGYMVTNKWVKDSVGWCYIGADGYCVTNTWKADSQGWCYLDANGRMVINNWVQDGGKWYYLDANGYMVTGTRTIGGKTYKFASNGVWIP